MQHDTPPLSAQHVQQTTVNNPAIYWFRNDFRLTDNPALSLACQQSLQQAKALALVVCLPKAAQTRWGFSRLGQHRKVYLADTVHELAAQCELLGNRLIVVAGDPKIQLPALMSRLNATTLYAEEIAAPEEIAEINWLRQQRILVNGQQISPEICTTWQSTLLEPTQLPFAVAQLPLVFSSFRTLVEKTGCIPPAPLPKILQLPQMPAGASQINSVDLQSWAGSVAIESRSAFPYQQASARAGELSAQLHLQQYLQSGLADHYKETRNGLIGFNYSTKFSPWLASGAISARQIYQQLKAHELRHGANDSTYWIWFELLWRDYFRLLHLRCGQQLYRAEGLNAQIPDPLASGHANKSASTRRAAHFKQWCSASTGQPLIDAGMRELQASGYLSNRMRQLVASYLVNDLEGDWRAGAAWFEAQLIDYDVYSNQGNWLYLAGRGTDPRTNRRFNLQKQQQSYDPDQQYLNLWRQ